MSDTIFTQDIEDFFDVSRQLYEAQDQLQHDEHLYNQLEAQIKQVSAHLPDDTVIDTDNILAKQEAYEAYERDLKDWESALGHSQNERNRLHKQARILQTLNSLLSQVRLKLQAIYLKQQALSHDDEMPSLITDSVYDSLAYLSLLQGVLHHRTQDEYVDLAKWRRTLQRTYQLPVDNSATPDEIIAKLLQMVLKKTE